MHGRVRGHTGGQLGSPGQARRGGGSWHTPEANNANFLQPDPYHAYYCMRVSNRSSCILLQQPPPLCASAHACEH